MSQSFPSPEVVLLLPGCSLATFGTGGLFWRHKGGAAWLGVACQDSKGSSDLVNTPRQERETESQFLPLPPCVNRQSLPAGISVLSLDGPDGLCPDFLVASTKFVVS